VESHTWEAGSFKPTWHAQMITLSFKSSSEFFCSSDEMIQCYLVNCFIAMVTFLFPTSSLPFSLQRCIVRWRMIVDYIKTSMQSQELRPTIRLILRHTQFLSPPWFQVLPYRHGATHRSFRCTLGQCGSR